MLVIVDLNEDEVGYIENVRKVTGRQTRTSSELVQLLIGDGLTSRMVKSYTVAPAVEVPNEGDSHTADGSRS